MAESIGDASWKPFVAGYAAGCSGLIVGYPLDSMKVLLQNSTDVSIHNSLQSTTSSDLPRANSIVRLSRPAVGAVNSMQRRTLLTSDSAAYAVARNSLQNSSRKAIAPSSISSSAALQSSNSILIGKRSLRSLYSGISIPLATVGAIQSLNFALYDSFRRILHERDLQTSSGNDLVCIDKTDYRSHDSLQNVFMSAFMAGSTVSVITSPLVILKTKQQLMMWSLQQAVQDTIKQPRGLLRSCYAGYATHLFCDSVGRSVFFVSYEFFKRSLKSLKEIDSPTSPNQEPSITILERMLSACTAGIFSWSIIYPFDVIKSKTYAHSVLSPSQPIPSPFGMAKKIWEIDGKRSLTPFFRGFGVTVARAGPVAAFSLPMYDLALQWLSDY